MPTFNFKTHASPKLGRGRPEEFQLSPQASRALLGSPESSPSLSRFFARRSPTLPVPGTLGPLRVQGIQNQDLMDKKRVDVAVRDQKSTSGRVWARMVHSMPTRKSPALDADVEAAARLV
jgi:hypothetical protein